MQSILTVALKANSNFLNEVIPQLTVKSGQKLEMRAADTSRTSDIVEEVIPKQWFDQIKPFISFTRSRILRVIRFTVYRVMIVIITVSESGCDPWCS